MNQPAPIVEGVFLIRGSRSNIYYLRDYKVLIDTGMPADAAQVLGVLRELEGAAPRLDLIMITHGHLDHVGSLAALQRETGARVLAARSEQQYIEGRRRLCGMPRSGLSGIVFRLMLYVLETAVQKYAPARVQEPWPDASARVPEGILVLATPGHSPGSQSYYLPRQGIVFVGDALSNAPALHLPQRAGCADHAQALRSAADIAAYDFDVCMFGHGEPLVGGAAVKIRALFQ